MTGLFVRQTTSRPPKGEPTFFHLILQMEVTVGMVLIQYISMQSAEVKVVEPVSLKL